MNSLSTIAQRFLPIVAVVLITVLAHRMVPSSVGILPRIFIITGIVVVRASWIVSRGTQVLAGARRRPPAPRALDGAASPSSGLGNMGGALVTRRSRRRVHDVTGWSRSALGDHGGRGAAPRSDLIVACVLRLRRDATRCSHGARHVVDDAASARRFVQLASGEPRRRTGRWPSGRSGAAVRYLDGAIADRTRPGSATTPTIIFYSGDRTACGDPTPCHADRRSAASRRSSARRAGMRGRRRPRLAVVPVRLDARDAPGRGVPRVGGRRRGGHVRLRAVVRDRDRGGGGLRARADRARTQLPRRPGRRSPSHLAAIEHIVGGRRAKAASTASLVRLVRDLAAQAVAEGHGDDEIAALVEVLRKA